MAGKPNHSPERLALIAAICDDYRKGEAQADIGKRYGMTGCGIGQITRRHMSDVERSAVKQLRNYGRGATRSRLIQERKIAENLVVLATVGDRLTVTVAGTDFIFDAEDEGLLRRYAWRVTVDRRLYRQTRVNGLIKNIYVYHDILGVTPSRYDVVDHINRNPRDNRRANLRVCSPSQNCLNRTPRKAADQLCADVLHEASNSMDQDQDDA